MTDQDSYRGNHPESHCVLLILSEGGGQTVNLPLEGILNLL